MTKTLIALPCMDMVHTGFMESMMNLRKPEGTSYTIVKNTLIHDSRNIIARNAIQAGFDRVMWLDSDMIFAPDTLERLEADMDTGLDFVSGLYFSRRPPYIKPVAYKRLWYDVKDGVLDAGAENLFDYPEGLCEIEAAGFGCCMTTVDLLKRVGDQYGAPFDPVESLGEDMAFCLRARKVGTRLWLDTRVKCGHMGMIEYNEAFYQQVKALSKAEWERVNK